MLEDEVQTNQVAKLGKHLKRCRVMLACLNLIAPTAATRSVTEISTIDAIVVDVVSTTTITIVAVVVVVAIDGPLSTHQLMYDLILGL